MFWGSSVGELVHRLKALIANGEDLDSGSLAPTLWLIIIHNSSSRAPIPYSDICGTHAYMRAKHSYMYTHIIVGPTLLLR